MSWPSVKLSEKTLSIASSALLLFIAIFLRLTGLGEQSLWIDEIMSLNLSTWPVSAILTLEDGHPPLYALLMKVVCPWLTNDLCGRIVSAVFGVASVGLMLLLGLRLYCLRVGIFAGLLLSISPLHVWYSREGRMYALLVFWSLLSSIFIESLRGKWRWGIRLGFITATLGGILTHYTYVGVIAAQVLFFLTTFRWQKIKLRLLVFHCLVLTIIGIVVFPIVREVIIYGPLGPYREFKLLALPYTAFTFVAGLGIGPPLDDLHRNTNLQTVLAYWPEVLPVVILGALVGLAGSLAIFKDKNRSIYILLWLSIPIIMALSISFITGIAYHVRYVIISLPAFLLIIAVGLTKYKPFLSLSTLGALVIISAFSIMRDRLEPQYARADMQATAKYLESVATQHDRIFGSTESVSTVLKHYFNGPQTIAYLLIRPIHTSEDASRVMRILSASEQTTWVVLSREWERDPGGLVQKQLEEGNHARLAARFPGVKVYRIGERTSFD